ncbi:hypothetical protein ABZ746_13145 [Streptomyces sp. NPDC020096]
MTLYQRSADASGPGGRRVGGQAPADTRTGHAVAPSAVGGLVALSVGVRPSRGGAR